MQQRVRAVLLEELERRGAAAPAGSSRSRSRAARAQGIPPPASRVSAPLKAACEPAETLCCRHRISSRTRGRPRVAKTGTPLPTAPDEDAQHSPTPNSAVRRLAISQGLSYAGRGAALTALIWALYSATGSAWWLSGAMLAIFGAATAVSPWTGHAGDRHDRRLVIIISAALAAVGFAACALLVWHGDMLATILVDGRRRLHAGRAHRGRPGRGAQPGRRRGAGAREQPRRRVPERRLHARPRHRRRAPGRDDARRASSSSRPP